MSSFTADTLLLGGDVKRKYPFSTHLYFVLTFFCGITRHFSPGSILTEQKSFLLHQSCWDLICSARYILHVALFFIGLVGYPVANCFFDNGINLQNTSTVLISVSLGGLSIFCWSYSQYFSFQRWQLSPGLNVSSVFHHKMSRSSWFVAFSHLCLMFWTLMDVTVYDLTGGEWTWNAKVVYVCWNVAIYPSFAHALLFSFTCDHVRRHARFIRSEICAIGKLRITVDEDIGEVNIERCPSGFYAGSQELPELLQAMKLEVLSLKNCFLMYLAVQNGAIFIYTIFKIFWLWVAYSSHHFAFLENLEIMVMQPGYILIFNLVSFSVNFAGAGVHTEIQEIYYAALETNSPLLNATQALCSNPNLSLSIFGFQLNKNNVVRMVYVLASMSYVLMQALVHLQS